MTAAKKDLYIEQGASFSLSWTYTTGGDEPTPVDLTGAVARMQVRKSQQAPVLLDATSANGKIVLGGANGKMTLAFSASDTNALTSKSAVYDLELEFSNGRVERLLEGSVTVSPNITQTVGEVVLS